MQMNEKQRVEQVVTPLSCLCPVTIVYRPLAHPDATDGKGRIADHPHVAVRCRSKLCVECRLLGLSGPWEFLEKDVGLTSWRVRFLNCWIHTLCPEEKFDYVNRLLTNGHSMSNVRMNIGYAKLKARCPRSFVSGLRA